MLETELRLSRLSLLNVTLNVKGEITGVFAATCSRAKQGCEFVPPACDDQSGCAFRCGFDYE
jgi:chorismate mutase